MATHSSIIAWRILWTEKPGGLLSMGSQRVGHDWNDLASMHALEKEMATHSSVLVWRIPGIGEPGGLPSMGLHRVGHDWWLHFDFSLSCIGEGNGNPFQCSCLDNPRDGGAWWATVYGVAQSWTRLKRLSSSSLISLIYNVEFLKSICPYITLYKKKINSNVRACALQQEKPPQ